MMKRIERKHKLAAISVFIWGILAHGMMLFNKVSAMDEVHNIFHVGATFTLGRWMLGLLDVIVRFLFGSEQYSLPLFNGLCSFLLIAVAEILLLNLFEIKKDSSIILISGIMTMFPVVVGLFGYMFTAPYYLAGLLLSTLGSIQICRCHFRLWRMVSGSLLISCAMGIYQAWLPYALCIMLMFFFKETVEDDQAEWKAFFMRIVHYGISCVLILTFYLGIMYLTLGMLGEHLSSYKRMDTFNYPGVRGYIERIILAYKEFFVPTTDPDFIRYNMYPQGMAVAYKVMVLLLVILGGNLVVRLFNKNKRQGIQGGVLLLGIPMAANFIFIMVIRWFIYDLMMYTSVMLFIFFIWLAEYINYHEKSGIIKKFAYKAVVCVIAYACVFYCRYANICYLKADLMQSQATEWLTTLITRIESVEGYSDELPVAYINGSNKLDKNWPQIKELDEITIEPYTWECVINDNSWTTYMKYRCGFEPVIIEDTEALEQKDEVLEMTAYPDSDSIKLVDGVIVVKF